MHFIPLPALCAPLPALLLVHLLWLKLPRPPAVLHSVCQVRWYQLAAFYPFMRGHAHLEAKRREPWLFGEENTVRIRDAIRQR